MTEKNKMRMITFYACYFVVPTIGTSLFNWFDVCDLLSWLRLLVVLILPFFILWRSKEKKTEEESEKGKKFHQQLFGVLVFIGFLVSPGTLFSEDADNFWLCSFFYGAAICLCFVGEYLRGRYLLLYCNPSVSDETRKRSRVNMRKQLVQMVIVGASALIFLLLLSRFEPEMKMPRLQKTATVQKEKEEDETPATSLREEKKGEMREEQEEQSSNIFLVILRYTVVLILLALVFVAVAYGLLRLFLFLIRGRRRTVYVFEELTVERSHNEEYTRLVPVMRKDLIFPAGNDGRIRRYFYKEVRKKAGNQEIEKSQTPMELKRTFLEPNAREERLTELYEKARYAKDSVTEEEISRWEKM